MIWELYACMSILKSLTGLVNDALDKEAKIVARGSFGPIVKM